MHSSTTILVLTFFAIASIACGDKLKVDVTKQVECDRPTRKGDHIFVHYSGYLSNGGERGVKFDTSEGRGPIDFVLGVGHVIQGWDEGLMKMCVGEERTLHIPSELGYGEHGAGNVIPPHADLIFDAKLDRIERRGSEL